MTPERWEQISSLFTSALELDADGRAALIDEACADDKELREEVEALLSSHEASQNFMERLPFELTSNAVAADDSHIIGKTIGTYRIQKRLGQGGMGAVYLAVRADDQYQKQVAVKLLKRGMDTDAIISRFKYERQILANLDHPNIARLHDGGTTDDGLPYFVMEYIEGLPLNEFCEKHELAVTECLNLFRTVCAAVSYAHQNLVVHRDIKPSNILVTEEGVPKLLDFGIAKVLQSDSNTNQSTLTVAGARHMTPDYASPEQIKGLPITTASDIYSLGVLLYELLTGQLPYQINKNSQLELEHVICELEPVKPSDTLLSEKEKKQNRQSAIGNRQSLRGDLDNIVLMALRKEPSRRYVSVEEFSRDIERYLTGLPVIARKDTLVYRATKFAQRHRVGVALAALFLLLILSFAVYTKVQSNRIERERDLAARERDRAEKVAAFMREIFRSNDPTLARGQTVSARELLDKGAAKVERELSDQPDVQAALMDTIGQVYESLGLYDDAYRILQKALATRRKLFGDESNEVAETLLHLAIVQRNKADFAGAQKSLDESLSIRRALHTNASAETIAALQQLILLKYAQKDFDSAERISREEIELCRKLYGNLHAEVSRSFRDLAVSLMNKPDADGAEKAAREAVEINRKISNEPNQEMIESINLLARILFYIKREYKESETLLNESSTLSRRLYGNEHTQVLSVLRLQSWYYTEKKDFASSLPFLREELELGRKLYGANHPEVALTLLVMGASFFHLNDFAAAERAWGESLTIRKKALGEEHPQVTWVISNLALLKYEKKDYAAAASFFRESVRILREAKLEKDPQMGHALVGLGKSLLAQGKANEAEPVVRKGIDILHLTADKYTWHIAEADKILGACLLKLKRYDEAEPLLVKSYKQIREDNGLQHKSTKESRQYLVKLYEALGQKEKAQEFRNP